MTSQLLYIAQFILNAFLHIWPYLLITIPVSVAVKMSGAAKYINKALSNKPHIAIILATVVGAFSPFCSCGVIPVVATLLLGGVPLAPVMSFWIASPSMDPEIFFLSVATLGWKLALWRLSSTLVLSLAAGYITQLLMNKAWLGDEILLLGKPQKRTDLVQSFENVSRNFIESIRGIFVKISSVKPAAAALDQNVLCCGSDEAFDEAYLSNYLPVVQIENMTTSPSACGCSEAKSVKPETEQIVAQSYAASSSSSCSCGSKTEEQEGSNAFLRKLRKESIDATLMVFKFMGLAFLLEALIELYVPKEIITNYLGGSNPLSILWAALLGVPVYTSNLAALPLIGGLLQQGMNPGAALAFLISGPVTTIPAMAAVWGLVKKRVFFLYVSFAFFGALIMGYLYYFVSLF